MTTNTALTYNRLLMMPQWQKKRQRILQRDGNKCAHCHSTIALQVHHRQYRIHARTGLRFAPWEYSDHLLITLCATCHEAGHKMHRVPVVLVNN